MAIDLKNLKNINFETIVNLPLKVKIISLCVLVVLIWGLYAGLALYPKITSIYALKKDTGELTATRDAKAKDAAYLPKLRQEVSNLEKQLSYSMTVLPNTEEIPKIIKTVEEKLKGSGLEILSFKPDREAKQDFYASIPISLKFSGTFKNIGDFVQAIGREPRIINITNINIASPQYKDGRVLLTVDTKAVTYRFLRTEEMPKKEEKKPDAKK